MNFQSMVSLFGMNVNPCESILYFFKFLQYNILDRYFLGFHAWFGYGLPILSH